MSRPDPSITANLLGSLAKSPEASPEKAATKAHPEKTARASSAPASKISGAPRKQAGGGHTRTSNRGK
jgi:hypothetical protein